MRLSFFLTFILFAISPTLSLAHSNDSLTSDTVSVSGQGFIEAEPDMVDLHINLTATKPTLKEAKTDVDRRYQQVLEAIRGHNISDKDIKLTRLNSHQDYEWRNSKRIFKGFQLSRSLQISIRDTDKFPDVQQSLIDAGISNISHVNPRFSDDTAIKELALAEAVKVAKRKAQSLAKQFDRQLGAVASISEGGVHIPSPRPFAKHPRAMMADSAESAPAPELLGTQKINATISVVFRLK